jgi:hypothetical protein
MRDVRLTSYLVVVLSLFGFSQSSFAQEAENIKRGAWTFGFYGVRHDLKSDEENNLKGVSTAVQLGYGHIATKWYLNTTLDIFSGPFKLKKSSSELDFAGTGASVQLGYTFSPNLRQVGGAYGMVLGLSYSDIIGKSDDNNDENTVKMKINNFSVFSGAVFCLLKPARPNDNKPENLVTRMEGYFLTLGISAPVQAKYDLRYKREVEETPDTTDSEPARERGQLKGTALMVYLSTWLGV